MYQLRRRAAATTAAASMLAGVTMLAFPGAASAETKTVECGGKVTAKPGDRIRATKGGPLGLLTFDLGKVTESTDVLTGTAGDLVSGSLGLLTNVVCKVTVKVADTVEPVPAVGDAASDTLEKGAETLDKTTRDTVDTLNQLVSPSKPEPGPDGPSGDSGGNPDGGSDPNNSARSGGGDSRGRSFIASPSSPAVGGGVPLHPAFLPLEFSSGFAPMRDYGGIPFATPGVFAPAPGIRYGSGIPGYAPEFDVLGVDKRGSGDGAGERVSEAGQATALPGMDDTGGNPASLPVLIAVISLAASTAGLVRTWVLRRA